MRISSYVLSNGKREIVFEAIVHVGKRKYYNQVKESIKAQKQKGHLYFYEQVKKSTDEDIVELGKFVGLDSMNTLKELYKFMGMLADLEQQPQNEFIGLVNDRDVNVDLSMSDLLLKVNGLDVPEKRMTVEQIISYQEGYLKLNPFLKFLIRNFLRFTMRRVLNSELKHKNPAMEVITSVRDDHLVSEVLKTHENLVITYGAGHFQGFYDKLIKADPSWKIVSVLDRTPV